MFEKRAVKNASPSVYRQNESVNLAGSNLGLDEYSLLLLAVACAKARGRSEIEPVPAARGLVGKPTKTSNSQSGTPGKVS